MNWSAMFGFLAASCFVVAAIIFFTVDAKKISNERGIHNATDAAAVAWFFLLVFFVIFGALCALTWGI